MAKFATNARGAMMLLNLIQVTESISGSVVPLAMFDTIVTIMDLMAMKTQIRKHKYENGATTDIPGNQAHITVHSLLINKSGL